MKCKYATNETCNFSSDKLRADTNFVLLIRDPFVKSVVRPAHVGEDVRIKSLNGIGGVYSNDTRLTLDPSLERKTGVIRKGWIAKRPPTSDVGSAVNVFMVELRLRDGSDVQVASNWLTLCNNHYNTDNPKKIVCQATIVKLTNQIEVHSSQGHFEPSSQHMLSRQLEHQKVRHQPYNKSLQQALVESRRTKDADNQMLRESVYPQIPQIPQSNDDNDVVMTTNNNNNTNSNSNSNGNRNENIPQGDGGGESRRLKRHKHKKKKIKLTRNVSKTRDDLDKDNDSDVVFPTRVSEGDDDCEDVNDIHVRSGHHNYDRNGFDFDVSKE